jgi:hypothetical protein
MEPSAPSEDRINFGQLFETTRARVYFVWGVLATTGFVATHYYQNKNINAVWFVLSVIGMGYMYRVMPLRVKQMRTIFLAWLVPITFGMVVSGIVFYVQAQWAGYLIAHLGAFWMLVMAVGYLANGIVDPPGRLYWQAVAANVAGGVGCFMFGPLEPLQYVIAAIVTAWSMFSLWLFRAS